MRGTHLQTRMQAEQATKMIENVYLKRESLVRNLKGFGSSELEAWCRFLEGDMLPSRGVMEGLTRALLDMTKKAEARWRDLRRRVEAMDTGIACMETPRQLLRDCDALYDKAAFLKDKLLTDALGLLFVVRIMDDSPKVSVKPSKHMCPFPKSPLSRTSSFEDPMPSMSRPPFFEARGTMTVKMVPYTSSTLQVRA